ncbi:MAG: hypothetical protein KAI47_19500 [Deltaproteobacteria bacterium]|nr:hypothetical protein [Deltaproteobacteria bacterium]
MISRASEGIVTPDPPSVTAASGPGKPRLPERLLRQFWRIRTRLLVINLFAVLVPILGIHGARTFER